jgi:2-polyprenyl-3-methyl-5-hydroxy-6-metoxy-1,4-benzoquinol methylase
MAMNIYKLELAGKRVLEIGCGIGLCSIVLHRMGIDITASDYHPRVREFLERNVLGNGLPPIKYQTGNWDEENLELGTFDVMIGSDILYQPDHACLVSRFIDRHSSDDVEVVVGDPGRANRSKFTRTWVTCIDSKNSINSCRMAIVSGVVSRTIGVTANSERNARGIQPD